MSKRRSSMKRASGEEGQSIITLALMSIFLVMLLAVVADTALVWWQRRDLQNSADAAALAAAQLLPNEGNATTEAETKANANEDGLQGIEVSFGGSVSGFGATSVTVKVTKDAHGLFGGVGFGDTTVTADATARIASFNFVCVVPLGVIQTVYQAAINDTSDPPDLVELRVPVMSNGTSNTGLLNLNPGNSSVPIAQGNGCPLTPEVTTKPGNTVGDVNNGLQARLDAAESYGCLTWDEVQPPANQNDPWYCQPDRTVQDDLTQASAVILVPILDTDIVDSGAKDYPVDQLTNGLYRLGYFWVSRDDSFDTSNSNNWQCKQQSGPDKCVLYGRFLKEVPVSLETLNPDVCPPKDQGSCVIDFDPDALFKIVQLIE